ncbi:MAG: NAD(+) diphosphatase [Bifidobacteriaceae bacterium]|nr:NAD(+) diphosphatase [Bifidobacteriaceae bacterium]
MTLVLGVIPGAAPQLLVAGQSLSDAAPRLPAARPEPVGDGISVVLAEPGAPAPAGAAWAPARTALPTLPPASQPVALRAIAVANWRQRSRFCPACGGPVEPDQRREGYSCVREDRPIFPRTDPCVITAIIDGADRLLLSHASNHPPGLYTLVAGFVEAGESLEAAVRREALEEVGVEVTAPRFLRSQPWPFPGSLMASFTALATGTAIAVDGAEITDAAWFTRPELTRALDSGRVLLPLDYSVARQTIESWRLGAIR